MKTRPGLLFVDIHQPGAPTSLGAWRESAGVSALAVDDGFGYMVEGAAGLKVLDLSDPLAPEPLAHLSLPSTQRDVKLSGDLAYMIERNVITVNDSLGNPVTTHGKVVTVWRKAADGSWKNVVDMWNEAPPPEE